MSDILRQLAEVVTLIFMLWSNLGGGERVGADDTPEMYTDYTAAEKKAGQSMR
jgi:hypothetical protein